MPTVALLGTCDTKLEELLYLRDQILQTKQADVFMIDVGRKNTEHGAIDMKQAQLLAQFGKGDALERLPQMPRSEVIRTMTDCAKNLVKKLYESNTVHAIIGAGGSGATSLVAPVMREALPIGFPKMIVSTVASGDTGPIVRETDITMMYSVVDVAGLNQVLREIMSNAGSAIAGAAAGYSRRREEREKQGNNVPSKDKKCVGITMFGVTTPGVDALRHYLESDYNIETYVFHATGHGGKAMERLVREGVLDAIVDLTTTEICDYITGGVFGADATRLDAAAVAGIPNIVSLGATDMTNFGPIATVPEIYKDRRLYEHNSVVTLMRSSEDECRQIGEFICEKLRKAKVPDMVELWIPKGGVSMIATPGGPFEDKKADAILFDTVREGLKGSCVKVVEHDGDVNDEGFVHEIAQVLVKKMGLRRQGG